MGIARLLMRLDNVARAPLASLLPSSAFIALYSAVRHPLLNMLARERVAVDAPSHPVEFAGLKFRNDLGNAAGFDKDGTLLKLSYQMGAGFAVVGTVLVEPHTGNRFSTRFSFNPWTPLPHSHSSVNSLGLPNVGVDAVVRNIEKFRVECTPVDFPIGVSIMGHPAHEGEKKLAGTVECLRRVLPVADFVEINESCPNVHGHDADALDRRIESLVDARDAYFFESKRRVPLFVKLATFGDAAHTVRFMTRLGVDGLVGVNTQKNYTELRGKIDAKDVGLFDYYTRTHSGGVSGAPIADVAVVQIEAAAREIAMQRSPLLLIHAGGIRTREDIARSRAIGAHVVLREWYTGMMERMTDLRTVYDVVKR